MAVSYIYVIDEESNLPGGRSRYKPEILTQDEAAERPKARRLWSYMFESEKRSEKFDLLEILARKAGVPMDQGHNLDELRVTDPKRLHVGDTHSFLLVRDDLKYEFFTPRK